MRLKFCLGISSAFLGDWVITRDSKDRDQIAIRSSNGKLLNEEKAVEFLEGSKTKNHLCQ